MAGIVTLSIELELGWGMHDQGIFSHLSSDRLAENKALTRLLDACDETGIPISFDVVGHLLHDSCQGSHPGPYPDRWWRHDPGTSYQRDPLFYASDMIDSIRERPTQHELCTHTYSHVLSDDASEELIGHELQTVREIHDRNGLPEPTSIVMPRHQDVDYSVLTCHGFQTIRRPITNYGNDRTSIGNYWWLLTRDHPACELRQRDGVVETTCTPYPSLTGVMLPTGQRPLQSQYKILPRQIRERLHQRYLTDAVRRAVTGGDHVHLWTHLFNLANDSQWRAIEPVFETLARARDDGDVVIKRMCDLSDVVS